MTVDVVPSRNAALLWAFLPSGVLLWQVTDGSLIICPLQARTGRSNSLHPKADESLPVWFRVHGREPTRAGTVLVPPERRPPARGLARMGGGGVPQGEIRGQAHPARHRRRLVSLVPRDRPGVVRRPDRRDDHQRTIRGGEGRPRRAARRGCAVPAGRPEPDPAGRGALA